MKIAIISDQHLPFLHKSKDRVESLRRKIHKARAKVLLNLGDLTEGQLPWPEGYQELLDDSLFIFGNHDLWRKNPIPPPTAMEQTVQSMPKHNGILLEKSWQDTKTIVEIEDHCFVGTMGFPDFAHPEITDFDPDFWNSHIATRDDEFMDLRQGWLTYTIPLQKAFFCRLEKAFATRAKHIIISTHYPVFATQATLNMSISEKKIWPFFFNWTIGRKIMELAQQNPQRTVWAFAGHCHEYCTGQFSMVAENIYTYGFRTDYGSLHVRYFDTALDLNEQRRQIGAPPFA